MLMLFVDNKMTTATTFGIGAEIHESYLVVVFIFNKQNQNYLNRALKKRNSLKDVGESVQRACNMNIW